MRSRLRWTLVAALTALAVIGLVGSAVTAAAPRRSTSGPAGSASAPAAHQAASALAGLPASSEPTIKTREIVNGKAGGEVPPPPADAMGSPADSTLVRTDDLYMTQINGFTQNRWAKLDGLALGSQGPTGLDTRSPESTLPMANPDYPTASGRFRDINSDRVMSLRLGKLGSDRLLTLSSANGTVEPQWNGDPLRFGPCRVGETCTLTPRFENDSRYGYVTADGGSGRYPMVADMRPGGGVIYPPGGIPGLQTQAATSQQFTLIGDAAKDGYFQLRNRAYGLCLDVLGTKVESVAGLQQWAVGLRECAPDDSQLWRFVTGPRPGLYSKLPDRKLAAACPSGRVEACYEGDIVVRRASEFGPYDEIYSQASGEPGGAIPTWSTRLEGKVAPMNPFAMAAGDLDRAVDATGTYHDEAVVAYVDTGHRLQVRVIDYNANPSHLLATAPTVALPGVGTERDGRWFSGSVGVAVGDFDGDSLNEIAVTWQDGSGRFHVTFLRYRETDSGGGRALTVIGDPRGITLFASEKSIPSLTTGYADTTAGEFDRDGHADVAIAYAAANPGTTLLSGHLGVASFTSDFKLRGEASTQFSVRAALLDRARDSGTWTAHGVKLAAGLFKFDPAKGFTFQRRELAVAWTEAVDGATDYLAVLDVMPAPDCTEERCTLSIALQPSTETGPTERLRSGVSGDGESLPLSLAAGGFFGRGGGGDPPLWGIAVALPPNGTSDTKRLILEDAERHGRARPLADGTSQYVLTAYDRDGSSLVVGAPLVLTVNKLTRSTLVAAQPPAHSDWLDGRFVNVSRTGDFDVQMGSSNTTEYKFDSSTKSGWNFGVSQGASVAASFKAGVGENNIEGSFELKEKFSKNWSHASTAFNKYSTKITTAVTVTGKDDDIVQGSYVTYYVYRYPILGPPAKKPDGSPCKECLPFYEVTIPGQVIPTNGYGRALAWYQPGWENGDALSYPKLVDGKVRIADLGSYEYVDDHGKTVGVTQPLLNTVNSIGGGKTTAKLQITGQTGSGNTTTDANRWNLGVETSGSASVSGDVGLLKAKATVKLSLGVDGGNSFSHTETGSTTSSSGSSFLLTIPTIDSNKGYTVGTAYYYDRAGVPKVIHGVDLTSSVGSSEFWRRYYGQAPDPALNLPNATFVTYNEAGELKVPKFSTLATRQLIRGFSALQPEDPSSPVTSGQPYASDPVAGDKVTFAVQLHDYSLVDSPPVPVEFYAVPVNAAGLEVTGAPQLVGKVMSLAIPSQGMVTVKSPQWTAIANGQSAQDWRIFAVVDPADTVHEIHPWKGGKPCPKESLDEEAPPGTVVDERMVDPMTGKPEELACGQNNQGYGTITVMPKAGTPAAASRVLSDRGVLRPARRGRRPALGPAEPVGARLSGFGLADGNRHQLRLRRGARIPSVRLGEAVMGLIYTRASVNTPAIQPVLVYDGPPSAGHLIASTLQDGAARRGGGDAQFVWRPTTPGLHTLYALMLGATPGANSGQRMKIYVLPPA